MKYNITVNNETFAVEVERAPGSVRTVARYSSDASAYIPTKTSPKAPVAPAIAAQAINMTPVKQAAPVPATAVPAVSDGTDFEVLSPMPGTVWKIVANVGDSVKNGQPVVILEAMKMEIEVAATKDGVLDKICVSQGQTVNTSDLIAVIK